MKICMSNDKTFGQELNQHILNLNKLYQSKSNQSLSEILNSYSELSKDYKNKVNEVIEFNYSSYNFNECTREEKLDFYNNQLQLIECLVTNSIYDKSGIIRNWGDIYKLLISDSYALTPKIQRKVVYSSSSTDRPIGDVSYLNWNGLQIIDIDIKNEELATNLKPLLFEDLKKYNWFLGICKSASKKSLHVWTKITPIAINFENKKVEFICNFRHKYSNIYVVLAKYMKDFEYTKDDIIDKFLDMAMGKPQQGIFISSDKEALLNTNFYDTRLDVNFERSFDTGVSSIDWITHPDLKNLFAKLDWFSLDVNNDQNIDVTNISELSERDLKKALGKQHYKHAQRWQLANTLNALYGEEKGFQIMCDICADTLQKELRGDIRTAAVHNKPISLWAIKELNTQHGFNIKIKSEDAFKKEIENVEKQIKDNSHEDPTKILNDNIKSVNLYLKYNQYLSDIKDEIIENLDHITLLEAGAGYGKTEMIKSLKDKTLLILPYTSTIKAKVEASEVTKDWLYYYGNKKPLIEDLMGEHNMSMTIDKFARLNVYELDQAEFKYIVIDESHLLFTSSYREVMGPCIQRLANCKAKVIMMTGTPTGEILFFPGIKKIRVYKEDFRTKDFTIHMCPTKNEVMVEMCKNMAQDIIDGKKILYPTNNGTLYYDQIKGLVQDFMIQSGSSKILNSFYYKKANYGEESMDNINVNKTIGNNDLICCTTYLSVGVDICDKYDFSVYFNETWIPQDIEQFANRLRNNDLHINMYLEQEDSSGIPINYYYVKPLDLSIETKDLLFIRDLIRSCNDVLERNQEESKYNPIISSILSTNKFMKYDETDCEYYIDETTYKLKIFEERYSDYYKQLKILIDGMKYYGYTIATITHSERITEEKEEWLEEYLKTLRHNRYNYNTIQTLEFLNHINDGNIDTYKLLLKGSYEVFKDAKYSIEREEGNIYASDIEILEKNIPIVLSLYKYYDCPTIKTIFEYCIDKKQNRINYTKLNRIRSFANIINNIERKRLDFPVLKFIKDAQAWARLHKYTTTQEVEEFLKAYAVRYANSIKDLVVDDVMFLENLYEMVIELWKVVIIQSRPSNGAISIQPFELLWERKIDLQNLYGNQNTKVFFELLEDMKDENGNVIEKKHDEIDEEQLPELEHTSKMKLSDVENELRNVIHDTYEYFDYSELDGSNDRFLRKQSNTNQLKERIFVDHKEIEEENNKIIDRLLFD